MKNNYCRLSQEDIKKLPERFQGFFLSPFQYNLRNEFILVPEDSFQEMIDLLTDAACKEANIPFQLPVKTDDGLATVTAKAPE
jgi:hypothetical protein